MVDLSVMAMCVSAGMALSYVVWFIATENGLRDWPRRRRRYRY
jgi:hypothetical protein